MYIRITKTGSFSSHDTTLWDQPLRADKGDEVEIEDVWGARIIELGYAEEIAAPVADEGEGEPVKIVEVREPETVELPATHTIEDQKTDPSTKRADRKAARNGRTKRKAGETVEVV